MEQTVHFYSDGLKLEGTILAPDRLAAGDKRAGIVIAHGFAGLRKGSTLPVARKLAVLLHRLWVTGEVYEPLPGESAIAARTA